MEELQDLIKFLKDKGLEHQKINIDVLCGIIQYFANKQETKQCNIADVSQQRELFYNFITWYNAKPNKNKEKMIYTDTIEEYLKL